MTNKNITKRILYKYYNIIYYLLATTIKFFFVYPYIRASIMEYYP